MDDISLQEIINGLMLDLSLATSLPLGGARNLHTSYIAAAAAAHAIGERTKTLTPKTLKSLDWIIMPLVEVLQIDIEHPMAVGSSFSLRNLLKSKHCIQIFMKSNCLQITSRVLDMLLSKRSVHLKNRCEVRSVVENIAACNRDLAQFYPWELVKNGVIRHCVSLLKYGDVALQTISSSTLASLSVDLEICKQMFTYGAIRPLLLVSDSSVTNDACMLAGLGCITQLCRIPEIGLRMVQQGAVPLLEKGITLYEGHGSKAIREKALYSLGFLSRILDVKKSLMTSRISEAIRREFVEGTLSSREVIIRFLMNVHRCYSSQDERSLLDALKDPLMDLMKTGPWSAKNLCLKAVCVLYDTNEDRAYLTERGLLDVVLDLVSSKSDDLQEVPVVALLYLCVHPTLPTLLLDRGVAKVAGQLLLCRDHIIRELCVVLLKALNLFNSEVVEAAVPEEKRYVLRRNIYNPQLYGGEYGGLVQDFLQTIVGNRHKQSYLRDILTDQDMMDLQLTEEEVQRYENTFVELDAQCCGTLDIDELKLLMVLMGEKMDQDELKELLDEYDTDKSGTLDFKEFVIMMKGWNTRFGKGLTRLYNVTMRRGHIGKATREFKRWWNRFFNYARRVLYYEKLKTVFDILCCNDTVREKLVAAQVQQAKENRARAQQSEVALQLKFISSENLQQRRAQEVDLRRRGISQSRSYSPNTNVRVLPPIS